MNQLYTLGIEIGSVGAKVAFYDRYMKEARGLDFSGGYGRETVPLLVQYVIEEDVYYYGHQVNIDAAKSVIVDNIMEYILYENPLEINGNYLLPQKVLVNYINYIIEKFHNYNPKSHIASLVLVVKDEVAVKVKESLKPLYEELQCDQVKLIRKSEAAYYSIKNLNKGEQKDIVIADMEEGFKVTTVKKEGNSIIFNNYYNDHYIGQEYIHEIIRHELLLAYNHKHEKNINSAFEHLKINNMVKENYDGVLAKLKKCETYPFYFNFSLPPFKYDMDLKGLQYKFEEINNKIEEQLDLFRDSEVNVYFLGKRVNREQDELQLQSMYCFKESYLLGTLVYLEHNEKRENVIYDDIIEGEYYITLADESKYILVPKGYSKNMWTCQRTVLIKNNDGNIIVKNDYISTDEMVNCEVNKEFIRFGYQRIALSLMITEEHSVKTNIKYMSL